MRKCIRCGREFLRLEGQINGQDYCHPDDDRLPDCYTLASWAILDSTESFLSVVDNAT